ncbi:MAG: hypothetical protein U1F66_08610 [bacterium]
MVFKAKNPNEAGAGDTPKSNPQEGTLQTSTYAMVAASSNGTLGSSPDQYTMGLYNLIPMMQLEFGDDNENLKEWIYAPDPGQENFPLSPSLQEGLMGKTEGPVCAPDPKGCEGRILRWFDLGPLPKGWKDIKSYLAKLYYETPGKEMFNPKIRYWDTVIGAKNQIKLPNIPIVNGHVYYVILLAEDSPIALGPMELSMDNPQQFEQALKWVGKPNYFVRGIHIKDPLARAVVPVSEGQAAPTVQLKALPEGTR